MYSVLIVDDEPAILFIFRTLLEDAGFTVDTASSAREALETMSERAFDVVVTDIRMETPSAGFDVLRFAKQLPQQPLVVIVTAFPVPSREWQAAGADELMVKGADTRNLVTLLEHLLDERGSTHNRAANE